METRDILKRVGLRPTRVRVAVLRAIAESPRPLSAAEIESRPARRRRAGRSGERVSRHRLVRRRRHFAQSHGRARGARRNRRRRAPRALDLRAVRQIDDDRRSGGQPSRLCVVKKSGFVGAETRCMFTPTAKTSMRALTVVLAAPVFAFCPARDRRDDDRRSGGFARLSARRAAADANFSPNRF